jgi:1-acyl-sn-glycerol-3-phosphate acyltransferase
MGKWEYEPARDIGMSTAERWQSLHRESDLIETACHMAWALGVRVYLRLWHRFEVEGREHLPAAPPFVLVGNHASHLDALLLTAPLPLRIRDRVFALAAGDVFFDKKLRAGFATTFINALPLWRRRSTGKALAELRERLVDEPCAYVIFPEGGRSRDGRMMKFKPGVGMILAGTDVPVIPCQLRGAFEACPAGTTLPRPRKIRLRVGEALRFVDVPNEREGWEKVTTTLQEAVQNLANRDFTPPAGAPAEEPQITTSSGPSGG